MDRLSPVLPMRQPTQYSNPSALRGTELACDARPRQRMPRQLWPLPGAEQVECCPLLMARLRRAAEELRQQQAGSHRGCDRRGAGRHLGAQLAQPRLALCQRGIRLAQPLLALCRCRLRLAQPGAGRPAAAAAALLRGRALERAGARAAPRARRPARRAAARARRPPWPPPPARPSSPPAARQARPLAASAASLQWFHGPSKVLHALLGRHGALSSDRDGAERPTPQHQTSLTL